VRPKKEKIFLSESVIRDEKQEIKRLERMLEVDKSILGCTECHSTYSETFLLGYIHGWIDQQNEDKCKGFQDET